MTRFYPILVAALLALPGLAQQAPAAPAAPLQLSPRAAYDDAMHPLEATRHSISNWSDIEVQALGEAVARAAKACAARDARTFTGDALIDLARLCALGQAWPTVVDATTLYIRAEAPAKPLLVQAYAARLDAALHLKDEAAALADGKAMLATLPYDGLTAEVLDEALDYMQFSYTADAIALAEAREPLLLDRIRTVTPKPAPKPIPPEPNVAPPTAAPAAYTLAPIPSIHELYASGLALAALQQLTRRLDDAVTTVAALDGALPTPLAPDDAIPIALDRLRYALLGQPLPAIKLQTALAMPYKLPQIPAPHAITSLLLFPDTCAHCVRMGSQFPHGLFIVEKHEAYFYALLAEPKAALPPPTPIDGPPHKPTPRELLAETLTVTVPLSVLDQFAAADYPTLLIVDSHGILRINQPVAEDALQPGGTLDSAIARVGAFWPTVELPRSAVKTIPPPQ